MDRRLSLRLFKPPLLTVKLVVGLPDENPVDHYGVINLPEGRSLNYLRQQVLLAKIQAKMCDDNAFRKGQSEPSEGHLEITFRASAMGK